MKGRQIASEVDQINLRLQLRKRQAEAGDIIAANLCLANLTGGCPGSGAFMAPG
jgi:hypothetical protein